MQAVGFGPWAADQESHQQVDRIGADGRRHQRLPASLCVTMLMGNDTERHATPWVAHLSLWGRDSCNAQAQSSLAQSGAATIGPQPHACLCFALQLLPLASLESWTLFKQKVRKRYKLKSTSVL